MGERAQGVLPIDPIPNGGVAASLQALALVDAGLSTNSHYADKLSAALWCASRQHQGATPQTLGEAKEKDESH